MRIHHTKPSDRDISKHAAYASMLGTYVTVLGTILGIVFTWSQLRIAHSEEERARRAEPLAYTLEAVNTHYQYEVQSGNITASFPAPSFRLRVTHGSLHSITAISFDGSDFHELSTLPIQDRWNGCSVDITMPSQSIIVNGDTVYDYFFLFLEPAEGPHQLDLVCSIIDLNTQQVRNRILHPISLAQLDFLSEGPEKQMLSVYDILQKKVVALTVQCHRFSEIKKAV